jgi:transposase
MARPSKYSPEARERFVRLVQKHTGEHGSQRAAIAAIAPKVGCTTETLRRWVRQAVRDAGQRAGLTTDERAELKRLEREVIELKRANEILKKASAYFAQAELDRRGKYWWINAHCEGIWGRVDLPRRADRPIDVLSAPRLPPRSNETVGAGGARRGAEAAYLARARPGLRLPKSLEANGSGRPAAYAQRSATQGGK